jgi:hypothetical protein
VLAVVRAAELGLEQCAARGGVHLLLQPHILTFLLVRIASRNQGHILFPRTPLHAVGLIFLLASLQANISAPAVLRDDLVIHGGHER